MKRGNLKGTVQDCLPNLEYRVKIDGMAEGETLRCVVAGKMKLAKIKVLLGDRVEVYHDSTMGQIGRIMFRL